LSLIAPAFLFVLHLGNGMCRASGIAERGLVSHVMNLEYKIFFGDHESSCDATDNWLLFMLVGVVMEFNSFHNHFPSRGGRMVWRSSTIY
jgi:hypothetical protein